MKRTVKLKASNEDIDVEVQLTLTTTGIYTKGEASDVMDKFVDRMVQEVLLPSYYFSQIRLNK